MTAAAVISAAWALSACEISTTQDEDDRLTVKAERTLVKAKDVEVGKADPDVRVTGTTVVRGEKSNAIAVGLENTSSEPVNDLPVAVGVEGGDGYLNLQKGVRYFQSHVPAIGPGEKTTWVFVTREDVPDEDEIVAEVGSPADPPLTTAESLPQITATAGEPKAGKRGGSVDLELSNDSGVPQFDLEVYAVARRDDEIVAAGVATLDDLEGGAADTLKLALVGDPEDAAVDVFAPPTIFK